MHFLVWFVLLQRLMNINVDWLIDLMVDNFILINVGQTFKSKYIEGCVWK